MPSVRLYRATVHAISSSGKPFRLKWNCAGTTKDEARADAMRRILMMYKGLKDVRIGGLVWLKPGKQVAWP